MMLLVSDPPLAFLICRALELKRVMQHVVQLNSDLELEPVEVALAEAALSLFFLWRVGWGRSYSSWCAWGSTFRGS